MNEEQKKIVAEVFMEISKNITGKTYDHKLTIALTSVGSEIDSKELITGAIEAQKRVGQLEVILIGDCGPTSLKVVPAKSDQDVYNILDQMFNNGDIDGAVTMHYPFPIGVSTVGKIITPARGKNMYIATTTGTTDTSRVQAMIKNAIMGIATAKADGIENPSVGILNIEGARQVEMHLQRMQSNGYKFRWGESQRADGGHILRGNDLITGGVDVLVTDSLTGNILMKIFSAYSSGGSYETMGYGYGPAVGECFDRIICILSRASGVPVIIGAIEYCAAMIKANLVSIKDGEIEKAKKAGWLVKRDNETDLSADSSEVKIPQQKIVDTEIMGIDILDLEDAINTLWKNDIYASSGMGCTGPVIMIAREDQEKALNILQDHKFMV